MRKIMKVLTCVICIVTLCFAQAGLAFAQETNPKNLFESAQAISLGDKFEGTVAVEELRNCYKVEIPKDGYYSLTGESTTRDLRMDVYNSSGDSEGNGSYRSNWKIKQKVEARDYTLYLQEGTHYIQFWTYGENPQGQYTFELKELKLPDVKKLYLRKEVMTLKNQEPWVAIQVNLKKQSDPKIGYSVWIADNPKFKNARKYLTDGSFHDWLTSGKTYYVKARTFIQINGETLIYGKFTKVKKIKL